MWRVGEHLSTTVCRRALCPVTYFQVDLDKPIGLDIELENFPHCEELVISPQSRQTYDVRNYKLRLRDNSNRELALRVTVRRCAGGSFKLTILAQYWLVNKSGVPLVFKQHNSSQLAAGQFEEHELAQSVTPLLFSYKYGMKDGDNLLPDDRLLLRLPFLRCTMRLGKPYHKRGMVCKW